MVCRIILTHQPKRRFPKGDDADLEYILSSPYWKQRADFHDEYYGCPGEAAPSHEYEAEGGALKEQRRYEYKYPLLVGELSVIIACSFDDTPEQRERWRQAQILSKLTMPTQAEIDAWTRAFGAEKAPDMYWAMKQGC